MKFCANIFENLNEITTFPEKYNIPKSNLVEPESLAKPITTEEGGELRCPP